MPGITSNQSRFRQRGTHPLLQLSHMLYVQSAINDLIISGPLSVRPWSCRHLPKYIFEEMKKDSSYTFTVSVYNVRLNC